MDIVKTTLNYRLLSGAHEKNTESVCILFHGLLLLSIQTQVQVLNLNDSNKIN